MNSDSTAEGSNEMSYWDIRYSTKRWPTDPDPALVSAVQNLGPGRGLDLGCGPGRNSIWLAKSGWDMVGVDSSRVALDQAAARSLSEGVSLTLVHTDLADYTPTLGSFELVILANLHFASPGGDLIFSLAQDALAPGGYLFVTGRHVDSVAFDASPADMERLYSENRLRSLFSSLVIEDMGRTPGRSHQGGVGELKVYMLARRPYATSS